MKKSILDVAEVIRSKNSGPYELTLDILFAEQPLVRSVSPAGDHLAGADLPALRRRGRRHPGDHLFRAGLGG